MTGGLRHSKQAADGLVERAKLTHQRHVRTQPCLPLLNAGPLASADPIGGMAATCIDEEARRIILLTSPWQPAAKAGKTVRARKTLPITFNLG